MEINRWRRQTLQALFLALVVVDALLTRQRILSPASVFALEGLALLLGGVQVWRARRAYRHDRASGSTAWQALEDGVGILLPGPLARLFVIELRLWACLSIWVFRRPRPGAHTFSYLRHSSVGVLLLALGFSAPVEFLLYELLIPWRWLRILLLVLGVYAIVWALAFLAALRVLPHECLADGLSLRYGIAAQVFVPYTAIEHVVVRRRHVAGRPNGFRVDRAQHAGAFVVGGMTQLTLTLSQPAEAQTMSGRRHAVTSLDIAVDDPQQLVALIRERMQLAAHGRPTARPAGDADHAAEERRVDA